MVSIAIRATLVALLAMATAASQAQDKSELARGLYLVNGFGCGDCHTPFKMGPRGPEPDLARGLSGHPQELVMPPPPVAQGPWIGSLSATNTAFAGPWGISYAANLTPDPKTGIGAWRLREFVTAMREGKHLGIGRPIKPPMPWPALGKLDDADLKAMYVYLMSRPPVVNAVPDS